MSYNLFEHKHNENTYWGLIFFTIIGSLITLPIQSVCVFDTRTYHYYFKPSNSHDGHTYTNTHTPPIITLMFIIFLNYLRFNDFLHVSVFSIKSTSLSWSLSSSSSSVVPIKYVYVMKMNVQCRQRIAHVFFFCSERYIEKRTHNKSQISWHQNVIFYILCVCIYVGLLHSLVVIFI